MCVALRMEFPSTRVLFVFFPFLPSLHPIVFFWSGVSLFSALPGGHWSVRPSCSAIPFFNVLLMPLLWSTPLSKEAPCISFCAAACMIMIGTSGFCFDAWCWCMYEVAFWATMSHSSLLFVCYWMKTKLGFHSSVASAPDLCLSFGHFITVGPPRLVISEPSEFDVEPVKAKLSCIDRLQETKRPGVQNTQWARAQPKAGHMRWHNVACTGSSIRKQF